MFNHFIPLALAAALGAAAAQGDLKGPPDQVTIPDDNVFTTVSKLRPGQGNWVAQSDVVVDSDKGRVWIKADAKVQARVAKLARKCNEGMLTPEEATEYDRYIAFADFIAILQAKARLLLTKKAQ